MIARPPGGDPAPEGGRRALAVPALCQLAAQDGELGALLARLTAPRPPWAGLDLRRPRIMGVINVTPDSFSDPGRYADHGVAIAAGRAMAREGADILDIGGESTRPGADAVTPAQEQARIMPALHALTAAPEAGGAGRPVSVDTRNAATMAAALDAGAAIINDVSALRHDPAALALLAARDCPVVLMHMLGEPATMQRDPRYRDVLLDIHDMLAERIAACEAAGIARARIAIDPGIGFGKTIAHNLALVEGIALLHGLGCALLLGVSRKRFIGRIGGAEAPMRRVSGSIAVGLAALARGVQILRVHDVAETAQAVKLWRAVAEGPPEGL
ncbi:MAG: dihydropteroate synthase [Alphaproteobacteria bacterium]|nr:dihydropteroate synthase [Alphaproteobacteria bacterium]